MNAIEALTLRFREVDGPMKGPMRVTAPVGLVQKMICEFEARGETPMFSTAIGTGCDIVHFGPWLSVQIDDDLPADVFKIESP